MKLKKRSLTKWGNPYIVNEYIIPTILKKSVHSLKGIKRTVIVEKELRRIDINNPPLMRVIEIETINRCNGECSFCPVNRNIDPRALKIMDESLFMKIIDQLRGLNYDGILALYSNNEPFMDSRIIQFAKYARESLPNAYIHIFTNGTLITLEKYIEIMKYLDRIHIDNYSDDLKLLPQIKQIYEYSREHGISSDRLIIMLRKKNEVLSSRGGMAPNKKNAKCIKSKCLLPFFQLVIRPDGKISLCCNDALGKYTLGDLNKNSIKDIWHGEQFRTVREKLKLEGRAGLMLCDKCDAASDIAL